MAGTAQLALHCVVVQVSPPAHMVSVPVAAQAPAPSQKKAVSVLTFLHDALHWVLAGG